ncbi:hypothetical protein [Acinetobacter sp. HY1485]|uniref:hypothetical protein n=1 Tax=Acinetobacter sp. HY1485 TaxID=2970918 RepID=UPI0022B99A91|nr:hypothetical protein [Acinetobacter sp. HY1485]
MIYMVVLVPIVLPLSFLEDYIESSTIEEDRMRLERNQGVLKGNRKALENCMKTCYSLWITDEEKELFDIAAKKLIALDDGSQKLTPKQANALMMAYSHI